MQVLSDYLMNLLLVQIYENHQFQKSTHFFISIQEDVLIGSVVQDWIKLKLVCKLLEKVIKSLVFSNAF